MNDDFRSRVIAYDNGDPRNQHFREYRLSQYSYAPTRERTYYNENWWDTWSSLMQSSHKTSISSLNDDNRQDEKEIEILQDASNITEEDFQRTEDWAQFAVEQELEALRKGDTQLMKYWRQQAEAAKKQKAQMLDTVQQADNLVKRDKQSFTLLDGHNPILEAIGEITDYISTGAAAGAAIGGAAATASTGIGGPVGSFAGGIIGAIGGALYGGYDYFASGRNNIDRSAYEEPLSDDKNTNYANSIKTRESYKQFRGKQIEDEQADLLYWQTEYPVSDYYRQMEQSGMGNYMYYNLPGIIGSSFSDTKDMGQQMVGSYGLHKLAKVAPKGKWAIRTLAFAEALRNGWQASLNENHAESDETATKKALEEIKKNKPLSNEMVKKARQTAKDVYGISDSEANELIDEETAFTMYNSNIGGLDPRNLENSYAYYKNARRLGDSGADQQFWRDMMATAGGDVLEAALMVTPYSAFAGKSKIFGRAVAGAALGSAVAEFSGMGVPGAIIGGIAGGAAAQVPIARKMWRNTMKRVQAIEDKLLPTLQQQVMLDKIGRSIGAFGATSLAEAAEEGTQYLNSLDAEKMRQQADYDLGLSEIPNLFANDLKKRGQVFKAVLSQIGLGESPYQNDQEFWSNWKGGLFLGGLMTGAMTSLREAAGAKKAYQAAKYVQDEILSSAVANRLESQDAILKGVAFAKHGRGGHMEDIFEALDKAKEKNKYRENTPFSDKDFENLKRRASNVISLADSRPMQNRLKKLGYDPTSEEADYALSLYTYVLDQLENSAREQLTVTNPEIQKALNDPNFLQALDNIAGPEILNDEGVVEEGQFKVKELQEDGSLKEYYISNREKQRRLQQKTAELLAITQLLKDLQGITDFKQWAKDHGLAFNSNQAERSIAELKESRDKLKQQVEYYSELKYDTTATYDQQIEYLKSLMLDYGNSGVKLVDAYRDQTLRVLNNKVYKNILNTLGLSRSADITVENKEEYGKASRKMTKMFMDNVKKNEELQEILDYVIKSDNDNIAPGEQNKASNSNEEEEQEQEPDYENMSSDDIITNFNNSNMSERDIKDIINNKMQDAEENRDSASRKLFGRKKERYWDEQYQKWEGVYNSLFGENEKAEVTEEPIAEQQEQQQVEPKKIEQPEPQPVKLELEDNVDKSEEAVQPGVDTAPAESESTIDTVETAYNDQNAADTAPIESNSEADITTNEGQPNTQDLTNTVDTAQQDAINNLQAPVKGNPRKIMPGWYLTDDGRIIPSERMYMANPIETKKYSSLAEKYKRVAAEIRFNLYKYINLKGKTQEQKLNSIRQYVSRILQSTDVSLVDPISKAVLNGDQNAVKLLIMRANPRTWQSYYVNEYFRFAFNRILEGRPVNRPEYIDPDKFKEFCSKAIQYKRVMENRFGWKFVTNAQSAIITIDGQEVVADPDVVAVDRSGNIHLANVHTMRNDDYMRWGNRPISMENTKDMFSILAERSAYADIQVKAFQEKPGVIISSTMLIPVVVNGYENIHRLYLGKLIPVNPSEEAVIKYKNQEDQLEELKLLLDSANKKAEEEAKTVNDAIAQIKNFRKTHKTSGYRFKKTFEFKAESEPTTVAEAYAQINRAKEFIDNTLKFKSDHIDKELAAMQKVQQEELANNKKADLSKEIEHINSLPDESKDGGVLVDIKDADDILNNKDIIQNGKVKMYLVTTPESKYIACELEYKEKTYKIHLRKPKIYGEKNGGYGRSLFPNYSAKMQAIAQLLSENPDVVITVDLKRSYISYGEKPKGSTPIALNEKESIISQKDIDNLGVQQDDGKIVNIGFYDEKTGVVQSGQKDEAAVLGRAPEGNWWQNQLFLVIKQHHAEDKTPERRIAIPLIKSKFNKNLANFIAQCFKVIAETNHTAEEDSQKRRIVANQMLHLFIGQRLVYKKDQEELPNIVYTNGDSVRLNGNEYYLLDKKQLSDFAKELRKCEIMPRWDTFNAKFRNLADGSFSTLYDHFSEKDGDFVIQLDGIDSGLKISKSSFDNDTLCQWLAKNGFFATTWFVQNEAQFSLHNLSVGGKIEQQVKGEMKETPKPMPKTKNESEEIEELTEEELKEQGYTIVDDEEDDEDAEYASPIDETNIVEYNQLRSIENGNDAIDLIATRYKTLAKLLRSAANKIGMPSIKFVVLDEQGERKKINGVLRQKKGEAEANADGTWTITFWRGNPHPIKTLAHEMVHVFTLGVIDKNTNAARAAKTFYSLCKDTFSKEELELYGFKNFKEFVAEFFTNPEMIDLLKSKDPISSDIIKNIETTADLKPKNMFQSAVSFISRLWNKYILRKSLNSYDQIYNIMSELLKDPVVYGKTGSFNMEERISIQDIMWEVIGGIKEKLSTNNKKEYSFFNHTTRNTIKLKNCTSASQLRAAVDGIMTLWIKHEDITPLGKNIDKLKFSTEDLQRRLSEDGDFAQWWHETFENSDKPLVQELTKISNPTKQELISEDNPKGYVTYKREVREKKKVGGKIVTVKKEKTFYKVELPNWDAVAPLIEEFMADMRIETRKKVEYRKEDEEISLREEGRNEFDELLTYSENINPLDRASREVKWMFSTVPAKTTNELGMEVFMPFRDVFGKVLYYTSRCHTTEDVITEFAKRAITGPDKEMFAYLHQKFVDMYNSRWRSSKDVQDKKVKLKSNNTTDENGNVFDANVESSIIKIMRVLRQQQNDFVWATAWDNVDKDGEKSKSIEIRTTLYQKGVVMAISSWRDQLATGMSGVLKYDTNSKTYKYQKGKEGLFDKIYRDLFVGKESFIYAYDKAREQDGEDVILHWNYFEKEGVPFSELTADDVKTYLHNALLELGVDVRQEVLEDWIGKVMDNPTVTTEMDALYTILSDQFSQHRPSNFFSRLATEGNITSDVLTDAFNSGFIKELANMQNEYDLRTQSLMTVASHNNQYYIVSESNYVNDIAKTLNKMDQNDSYIQMLQEDSFAQGSVVSEALQNGEKLDIHVSTFVGMKTKNVGDQGRDYFEIERDEDVISKFELLHEGYMISPTQSDKKTYHVLRGIPLVGMLFGKRSNTDCYGANIKLGEITIKDNKILDRFISYFESEKNAVEKAIIAYEEGFYKKNPGKKIANYSDANGMRFSSFNSIPFATGEPLYLNAVGNTPRQNLSNAYTYFFNKKKSDQREIMARILFQRAKEDLDNAVELGLIKRNEDGTYENVGLDGATIFEMANNIGKSVLGDNFKLKKYEDQSTHSLQYGPNSKMCLSLAIQQYVLDCSIKHLMSMQEYQRLFSGSKSFYKWTDNGTHVTDISVDYTKRRGGDISTGGVNVTDIDPLEGMEELGTYRVIEVEDYNVESTTLNSDALTQQFEASEFASIASVILSGKDSSPMDLTNTNIPENLYQNKEEAERIVLERYGKDFVKVIKQKAKSDAMQYFRKSKDSDKYPVNVADGATYITDRMCEKLLREEGKWDDDMKYAFEVLRGQHGASVMSEKGQKLYKSILDTIIGTQKYTATGFRKSDDGQGGTLMTPYYNKTALFPIFDQIAYGKMQDMLGMMRANNVDMVMMTSAVKVGGQGAISFNEFISGRNNSDHAYVQEMRFLRKQLNTDPNERDEMNLGTQTIKIALSNLRMNDDYIDPFTGNKVKGKELYNIIMKSYNILTDIGFEEVMHRFCKTRPDGNPDYINSVPAIVNDKGEVVRLLPGEGHVSLPNIDEEKLSIFLREELMSRDCNDNMLDAITYDSETDRLAAPLSAISGSGWIDSIIASFINNTIIDTKSPGSAYIQRSVFAMEGEALKSINGGKELKLINADGSMDAVISIDFFKDIIPNYDKMTFEQARQWLIDHNLVGENAKTYTISYRIPTQAQSSINPLKFVDVVPIIRDSIILPKEFTKLTGSDFDIDKLFLSRLFINQDALTSNTKSNNTQQWLKNNKFVVEDQMFTFPDKKTGNTQDKLENLRKGYTNKLLRQYLTLLMDQHSHKTKWRPIDADTKLWKDVYEDLYENEESPIQSMSQDTIAYQTIQKNNFVTGKIGIGPYALNNNNHIYTMLYGISLNPGSKLHNLGEDGYDMGTLCRDTDIYGNSILSWLSGGINAHVDIAKDPFVTKLNINEYTYNISNFLLRAGFGRNGLWFLNLPVIKELAKRMNAVNGQYLKTTNKDLFEARDEILSKYKQELLSSIPEDVKKQTISVNDKFDSKFKQLLNRDLTVNDILLDRISVYKAINSADPEILKEWIKDWPPLAKEFVDPKLVTKAAFDKVCDNLTIKGFLDDMVQKDKTKSILYRMVKKQKSTQTEISKNKVSDILSYPEIYNYIAVTVFDQINQKEAKTTSDLTKYAKIDTKKQGSTAAAQIDFLHQYNKFVSRQFGEHADIKGDIEGFFGITDEQDVMGFDTSLRLNNQYDGQQTSSLLSLPGQVTADSSDILNSGYVSENLINPYYSFIERKTKKAINSLLAIIKNDSVEGTYGFSVIWERIKSDFGKGALTDEAQSKLRSAILGAIKNMWVHNAMRANNIDPVTLFKDTDTTKSLAHELVALKTKRIVDTNEKGRKRIISVREKFKNNALLNILYDAHAKDDYLESDKLIEILDFIMVHIPFTDDTKKSNVYIRAWKELYEDEATKDFAVKLMFYSLLTSNDTGGNNLFKYVPFQMLKDYGLFEAERSVIDTLGDPSLLLGKIHEGYYKQTENMLEDIIEHVESILSEDFYFSPPSKLESKKVNVQEYTGFGNVFGKNINNNEKSTRIPYVFIPIRINSKGVVYNSRSLVDRYGNIINRSYIRVLNPIANFENQQKYLNYKRIGQISLQGKIYPIYKLVNSPLYTLGQYKVYNYGNMMNISSSQAITNMGKYIYSSAMSIKELDDLIADAVKNVRPAKDSDVDVRTVLQPLEEIDQYILKMHMQQEQEYQDQTTGTIGYEFRIFNIKNNILTKYDDYEYLREYNSKNESGKQKMLSDLQFALDNKEFSQEEKNLIADMISTIKQWNSYKEQSKPANKQPNTDNDPKTYTMHSGGAYGADTDWTSVGTLYGMQTFNHYYYGNKTPNGNVLISKADYEEGVEQVKIANNELQRKGADKYYNLLGRNWVQVKNSDAIFAIGTLQRGRVDGGTGWAVQMAIDNRKPVHIFDLNTQKWYTYNFQSRTFEFEETPKLTKNFAGIGTRSIDPNIEEKTNDKVKYVGDEKRQAALDAMDAVFRNTFGDPKPQPKNPAEFNGKNNPAENFNGPKESQEVLESSNTILSNKEILKLKPYTGSDTHPRIAVASEHADPAFFSQQIVGLFDEGKPLTVKQMKTVKTGKKTADGKDIWERKEVEITYTAEDFDALYIITKHDGLPLKKILQTKIPKLIHFSVTGMGGTSWEPGVMKYQDMLKRIKDFMKMGLDPEMVTMRIDPIIPGVTPFEVIEDIVKKSAAMGIETIKFSVMDWYRSTAPEVVKNTGYDYSKYYEPELDDKGEPKTYWWCPKDKDGKPIPGPDGKPQWEKHIVYKPDAKVEEQKKISDFMLSLKDKYGVTLQSCAEPLIQEGIEKVGCLSVPAINNMLGTHIVDKGVDNNKQRALCTCYGGKTDLMSYDQNCASVCWYCYAHHQGDKILNYYNPDGTLKDNAWTRTGYEEQSNQTNISFEEIEKWANSSDGAHAKLIRQILDNYKDFLQENIQEFDFRPTSDGSYYLPDKRLTIPKFYEDDNAYDYQAKRKVVLHELIHVLTTKLLTAYEVQSGADMSKYYDFKPELVAGVTLNDVQIAAIKNLEQIAKETIQYIQDNKDTIDFHPWNSVFGSASYFSGFTGDGTGFNYVHEFCSEVISNPGLQQIMKNIKGTGTKKTTVFQKFLDSIKQLLGITSDDTLLEDAFAAVEELITGDELPSKNKKGPEVQLSVDPESWSKKEGWSVDYFNKKVLPRIHEAWQMEYEVVSHAMGREAPTAGPSSYTYKDGTKVDTPFQLTVEQANALEKIEEFINSDDNVLTVSGYAGTGKTSVMEIVAQRHKDDYKHRVIFTASTNKASSVLGSKVKKKGFSSSTLDKYFALGQGQKSTNVYYDARQTETNQGEFKGSYGDIVIIDEASMINREKYNIISDTAKREGLKIIFLGDIAQLPPVGETISPVFENNENLIQLTEVKRTGDNAILKEATNLRQPNGDFSYVSSFNAKGEGVAFTSNKKDVWEVIYEYAQHLKEDPNFVKIVAGTNKAVEDYNTAVRKILGYDTPIPQVGENVMGYDNWGRLYDPITRKSSYKIVNSEDYIVIEVGKTSTKKINLSGNEFDRSGETVDVTYTPITLKDSSGKVVTVPFVLYSENVKSLFRIANATQQLKIAARNAKGKAKRDILEAINYLSREIMCDRDIADVGGNVILKKGLDFGYAITSHKSQGSTYKNVIIDKNDMDGAFGSDRATAQRMYYTAISRATTTATVYTRQTKVEGNPISNPVGKNSDISVMEISMYFAYEGQSRQEVMSDTTFNAMLSGERTATTRYESDYAKYPGSFDKLKALREGDIITFRDTKDNKPDSRRVNVRITKALHKLSDGTTETKNTPKVINVSSYSEYKHLSNFAIRSFNTKFSNKYGEITVQSVEQAFHLCKVAFMYDRGDITESQFFEISRKILSTTNGKDLRNLGKAYTMSQKVKTEWDSGLSDKVLYMQMRKSFEQNKTAADALLETGDAEFTHNYNNGNPIEPNDPKRFGRLLSKVRSDIREQRQIENNCK